MEQLDTNTLYQLHNYVFPNQPIGLPLQKKNINTLKKKQKREHSTEEKIQVLEHALKKFNPKDGK